MYRKFYIHTYIKYYGRRIQSNLQPSVIRETTPNRRSDSAPGAGKGSRQSSLVLKQIYRDRDSDRDCRRRMTQVVKTKTEVEKTNKNKQNTANEKKKNLCTAKKKNQIEIRRRRRQEEQSKRKRIAQKTNTMKFTCHNESQSEASLEQEKLTLDQVQTSIDYNKVFLKKN